MSTVRELRGITPTFQAVLNKQIGKTMDALDEWRLQDAFQSLQTLIDSLRPEDADPFLQNDLPHIEQQLRQTQDLYGTNIFRTNFTRRKAGQVILHKNLRDLFRQVMRVLHKGGYLELRLNPRYTDSKKLDVKSIES